MSDTEALYQEIILEHNRKPRNFRDMPDADRAVQGRNPMCGDALTLWVKWSDDDRIADVSFKGEGCAISKASASLMTSTVKGKTREEATKAFERFHELVTGTLPADQQKELGSLRAFSGVSRFPLRVKCASLAWHALKSALDGKDDVVTTDAADPAGAPGEGA
jgi:nitrogen fixation protein NifU and related proteins